MNLSIAKKKLISWVIPCFNEQEVISETLKRVVEVSSRAINYDWEIIVIDDGSIDCTREIIKESIEINSNIKLIGLSRNFGHQYAVQAGLNLAKGCAVIIIDADLQDPPELAERMLAYWEKGYDVVYGQRVERYSESIFKKLTAKIFYRLLNSLSEINIPQDTGDFRLVDRKVVEALKQMPERGRFIRGLISWSGFKQFHIKYKRDGRYAGRTKYSLEKMIVFALEGITSFSRRPLKLATSMGVISAFLSFLGITCVLLIRLFTNSWVEGWATLALAILFTSGVQLICLGILGEYIGGIYLEAKARPIYFIDETKGFDMENK